MSGRVAICDFETRSDIDLKKAGVERYVQSPHFDASCLAWCFDDGPVYGWDVLQDWVPPAEVFDLFRHVADGGTVVAHNARFELNAWREMNRRHPNLWPDLRIEQLHCTMAMARTLSLPGSLRELAPALRMPLEKDTEGHRLMLKLCKPIKPRKGEPAWPLRWHEAPADLARQLEYCKRDVEVERELWKRLPKITGRERQVWELDQRINDRGVYIDAPAVRVALAIVTEEKARLDGELFKLSGGFVKTANSAKAMLAWLKDWHGLELPNLRKDTVAETLARNDLPPVARRAIEIRQEAAKSSTGKLQAMLNGLCADGTCKGLLEYHGASTGRWAGRRVQTQNMPRTPEAFEVEDAETVIDWMAVP